ncbi:hypothetical protein [Paradevosia shaoguanensis]|uniref:Uncharacterized protein n=1 Tax=Paradevosia shaoguanensis TaxID=1335043 RepID=A0AA41QKN3_9HYPH|nr:hypothetical protein [Paradevosia shaoguanensis]MCF1741459.1 hypothetical protein [Paradevosia shaoguanensis]MCI0125942.1 hypothetical protein [Paradevosia shaoguanensis]
MAARNDSFPWTSHYGHYRFFETQMARHGQVKSLKSLGDGVYELVWAKGSTLRAFICECYAFGVAEYLETTDKVGKVDAVIINSMWCGYTPDAKRYCREEKVGLFRITEFMSALHRNDYWAYLTDEEKDYFRKQGWL